MVHAIKQEVEASLFGELCVALLRHLARWLPASDKALPFRGKEVRRPLLLCQGGKSVREGSFLGRREESIPDKALLTGGNIG
jgi:hypothetical protein